MFKENGAFTSPIFKKITLIILCVSLGGIILSGILINLALDNQFKQYLTRSYADQQKQIITELGELYIQNGGWPPEPVLIGYGRNMPLGYLLYVTDLNNRIVIVTRPGLMPSPRQPVLSISVTANRRKVGTAFFTINRVASLLNEQDRLFRATINRSILWMILLTGGIAFLTAFFFASRLSRPITEMNGIAKNMASGNLESRVVNLPRDEVGELGYNINQLAERLKQVEELRKKMTADVAHDLRTPLCTVRSYLEGMIDGVIPPSRENLDSLVEEILRLTALINDLQEVADADRTVRRLHIENFALVPFLEDSVKKLMPLYQEKGVSLALVKDGSKVTGDIQMSSDRKALTKILDNLLYNAYKFTSAGKRVFIGVEYRSKISGGNVVEISVTDEGVGIPAADLPFIFERFYRTDQSRNRESGGFGLGLTIVKELTEALGGRVTVTSEVGKGSRFTVELPG